ncbi:ATP-binding protein [Candidatus Neptunochlamydia vexilliferae]|nr:ATP-binding protein [Candidatus Neptunochlamydia vexilliferae]
MIPRLIEKEILKLIKGFPILALTGPRQSGKSTLIKGLFKDEYDYVSLENLDTRAFAQKDPRGFLEKYRKKVIFDEAQLVPELFSYLQEIVDEDQIPGQFILTGSQHFLLLEKITQSLAGRVAMLHLLPLSLAEREKTPSLEETLYRGFYPPLYTRDVEPYPWYDNYIQTYVERDLRAITNIHDLGTFQRFMKMCAARCGQLIDLTSLGNDCGISHNTAKSWLNILEASFITFPITPHFKNFNKRLVKTSKLYFYDTGLLCHLLDIRSPSQLSTHYLRGGIFESFVFSELMKASYNIGRRPSLYFWRDQQGHEIDCLVEHGEKLIPIEIKSGKTINSDFFSGLEHWCNLAGASPKEGYLIYGGNEDQKRTLGNVLGWKSLADQAMNLVNHI